MQVTQTSAEGLKREFKVVVDAGEIEEKVDARLDELKKDVRMPGFRPGKVPVTLLKKRYGGALRGEVIEDAMKAGTQQALDDNALRPAVQPKFEVTQYEEGSDLEYTMSLEVMPEIEMPDLSKLSLERLVAEVAEEELDETVARIASQHKSFEPAPEGRKAESGDALVIDFVGKVDGEPFEGGSATDHQLELGSSSFIDTFEDQLVGVAVGDHREVNVTFPEEYPNTDLAGTPALFEVDVKEIKVPVAVAVNDDFAATLGLENLEALRRTVREQIERERTSLSRERLKRSLLDVLAESHDFEVPPSMVEMEFDTIWKQLEEDMERNETTFESMERSEEEVREEYRGIADRRVRLGLLVSEIGRTNNIEVQQDELNRAMIEQARRFPGEERKFLEFFQNNPEAAEQLKAPLFEDKVVDFIFEMADVAERAVSLEELMQEPDAEQAAEAEAGKEEKPAKKTKAKKKAAADDKAEK
jgi:trigger factor